MKKVLKTVADVLSWIILAVALLITILVFSSGRNNGVANLFGFIPMTVESDSMKPTFSQGDLIICREVDDIMQLQENDVITFWTIIDGKKVKNTHRIVGINQAETTRSFVTRGDNNNLNDDMPAYAGDIIGKWTNVRIGGLGTVMNFLRTKTGFFICILIPMAIFFLIELYKFIVTLIEVKAPKTAEIDEDEIKRRAIEEYLAAQKQENGEGGASAEADTSEKTETPAEADAETAESKEDAASDTADGDPA
ncbi:MAG: signal peptidase I [Oscillospiraceae bacterium]|nr:signal peptidase I [Oscillospiraceae bacterium]